MNNDLWLYQLMVPFFSDNASLLGSALRLVCEFFGITSCAIRPAEYKRLSEKILVYKDGEYQLSSFEESKYSNLTPIKMTCKTAFEFADFYCQVDESSLSDEARKVFSSFCQFFYDELMGQFVSSGAPVVMEVAKISKNFNSYPGSKNTVENINFTVHRGQLTVLMGPSGCGKSTVLNIMGGLLKPTSGSVYFYSQSQNGGTDNNLIRADVCQFSKKQMTQYRRDSVGFIFQNYNLIADLTAGENVKISESLAANPSNTMAALQAVGLEDKSKNHPFRLSGGEQQRICIARALVKNADLLLCDEPTGALDSVNSKNVMTILQRQAREQDVAVVVVTHNPDYEAIADHYIEMKNGKVIIDDYRPFPFDAETRL